ncbi:MAG TPA: hypothetical protein VK140_08865 [Ktedonobacteraceae bacterium]|nr:hypothetical protein [Ktedonobacteraceae bacterium]
MLNHLHTLPCSTIVPLIVTNTLQITPLLDIRHEDVAQSYREGVSDSIRHRHEPVPLTSLLTCLKQAIAVQVFDGQHQQAARAFIGCHLGTIHGAVLTAKGTRRPDVSTLVLLESRDAIRGYRAGRHWLFEEAEPQERRWTDDYVVERFHELALDAPDWHDDPEGVWQFTLACLVGELSGQIFPVTPKEQARWEREREKARAWLARQQAQGIQRDTEPVLE